MERRQERHYPDYLPLIPGSWIVTILGGSILLVFGLMVLNGIVIRYDSYAFAALASAMAVLGACRYHARRMETLGKTRLRDFSESVLLFMAFSLLGVVSTYPIAALSSGFVDGALARGDALMLFDWNSWYAFVIAHPVLRIGGTLAYSTIYLSPAILLGYMAWNGQRAAARQFILSFWLAATITLLLFPLFPAKGPLAVFWTGDIPYMPITALYQSEMIPELRTGLLTQIDLGALRGLVCAPSFHTVSAVLYIAAAWPIAQLRWPLTIMNGAMLLSTPVEGNHYLTDMLLGLTVALFALTLLKRAMRMMRGSAAKPALVAAI